MLVKVVKMMVVKMVMVLVVVDSMGLWRGSLILVVYKIRLHGEG